MDKASFDPVKFKEQERAGFNLVADRYEQAMVMVRPVTARLIALADLEPGMAVLDVATGPGNVAREAANKVGLSGSVVGVDIAEEAVAKARQKAAAEKTLQLSFEVADAEALQFEDDFFDRVFCAMGLMHFPSPSKALEEFNRVLKPGGILLASVWGEENSAPFISAALSTLTRNFPPPKVERPSMFRFGRAATLANLVESAGFENVKTEPVEVRAFFPDASAYWHTFLDAAGITAVALAKQPIEIQQKLEKEAEVDLAPYRSAKGYEMTSLIMVVRASAKTIR